MQKHGHPVPRDCGMKNVEKNIEKEENNMTVKKRMEDAKEEAENIINPKTDEDDEMILEAGREAEKNPHFNPEGKLAKKVKEVGDSADTLLDR